MFSKIHHLCGRLGGLFAQRSSYESNPAPLLTFEGLEPRVLMTAVQDTTTGALSIDGTEGEDVIEVEAGEGNGNVIVHEDGGDDQSFTGVTAINIRGLGGGDAIIVGDDLVGNAGTPLGVNVDGGAGNDLIVGGTGDDTLIGGDDNDRIADNAGNNTVDAGEGLSNRVDTGDGNDTITAGAGGDKINDTGGNNSINAGEGHNKIRTGAGNDSITTGSGNDKIDAGGGNNLINAGNGNNKIETEGGLDTITSGSGKDKIKAGAGNDSVSSGDEKDKIGGEEGDDNIDGGDDDDNIDGGEGADTVTGGDGRDKIKSDQNDQTDEEDDDQMINETEPNDDGGTANPVTVGLSGDAELLGTVTSDNIDVFALTLTEGGVLEVEAETKAHRPLLVEVFDSTGTNVLATVNLAAGEDEDETEVSLLAGSYFVRATTPNTEEARYEVELSLDEGAPPLS